MLHTAGVIPWKRFIDVPPFNIYGFDEVASNPSHLTSKVCVPQAIQEKHARLFTVTLEGNNGKVSVHVAAVTDGANIDN